LDAVQRQPFVAVVGASGSGKSSVVRAGLVPRLRSDRHTAWETVILVPTAEPMKALAGRNFSANEWQLYFPGQPYHKTFPDLPGPEDWSFFRAAKNGK
jgi:hypothetical protein